MHFKRFVIEQLGQSLGIIAGLLDRIVLTAVLLRFWGETRFEAWSVCLALAGLVSLFEGGFSLYFHNRLMEETEQGREDDAVRTFFMANTMLGIVAASGFVGVIGLAFYVRSDALAVAPGSMLALALLAVLPALRIAASACLSLYRANRQYARFTWFYAVGEATRIGSGIIVCLLGGSLVAVAAACTLAAATLQIFVPVVDVLKRFPPHRIGFAPVRWLDFMPIFITSSMFVAQSIPTILLTSLPVIYLEQRLGIGMLTTFLLMRTLAGFPRTLLQQLGTVLGQECGRCIAAHDRSRARRLIDEGSRFYAILSGVSAGLLFGAGSDVVTLWTGQSDYFRIDYVAAAVASMLLTSFAVLAHNVLTNSNHPGHAAAGRWAQFSLTVATVALLPVDDLQLRVLIALSVGEIIGFAPIAYYGVERLVPGSTKWFYVRDILLTTGVALVAAISARVIVTVAAPQTTAGRAVTLLLCTVPAVAMVPWLGIQQATRRALFRQFGPSHFGT